MIQTNNGAEEVVLKTIPVSVQDAFLMLKAAEKILFVPGYGAIKALVSNDMKELSDLLCKEGKQVFYAIHSAAGRKSGCMKIFLEEAGVPEEQLVELNEVNKGIAKVDVCLVIGASDVVNLAARDNEYSPIYGMPIIHADGAKSIIVLKRSTRAGFSGVENPLLSKDNTRMVLGNPKATLQALLKLSSTGS